jgi:anthraniloyl-CoA monooxygenase
MRVTIVGAGPAGLYLAILLQKADPGHEVVVLERNPPDATFGWGVVFSEETLGRLRDADELSYRAIGEAFATWTTIDVHYRGERLRSHGHRFSAIRRTTLLAILQERARALGAQLRFEHEVSELPEADLVVGADGVNSLARASADFGTRIRRYPTRFAWFGADVALDAFTFAFRDTEHGLFQAHAYPFDAAASTFIVEAREDAWERAGLDRADEEQSIAFCEDLFADVLSGHRLLSNRSIWLQFAEVSNAGWRSGNLVLLGDAAHTAHFSIGSGTKLAMEDSVALADAFARHRSVAAAAADYELERRPVVERLQEAARQSARYFEEVPRYHGLDPVQFAFNLITRSGRIGHANLTIRDPRLVRALDGWFAGAPLAPPPLFAPLRLAGAELSNRVVAEVRGAPGARDGVAGAAEAAGVAAAAGTGAALVLTRPLAVTLDGRISPDCAALHSDEAAAAWAPIADAARVCALITHAGRRGSVRPPAAGADVPLADGAWPLVSASPLPYGPGMQRPAQLDEDGMAALRDAFAAAAARAARAGFAALELDLADGRLLGSFLSPLSNRRDDAYGGPLEARLRFPLAVLGAVRKAWPAERPLIARIPATDWTPRGITRDGAPAIAAAARDAGADAVHVVAGLARAESAPEYRRGYLTDLADLVRTGAGVTTLVGGYLTTLDEVNTIVGAGRADLCVVEPEALTATEGGTQA